VIRTLPLTSPEGFFSVGLVKFSSTTRVWNSWPRRMSGGRAIFSTATSAVASRRMGTTSMPTPFSTSVLAIVLASPRFSLPSVTMTIRLAVSSGKEAWASLRAAAMFVASVRI
jgi:hypothetical protein